MSVRIPPIDASRETSLDDEITTWGDFLKATPAQRRRCSAKLLREWEENRARELAEDERGDAYRGHWGD